MGSVRPKEVRFPVGDTEDPGFIADAVALFEQQSCAGALVHSQIRSIVVVCGQCQAGLGQCLLKAKEVRRLVIDDHTVEVEHHGANHAGTVREPSNRHKWQDLVRVVALGYSPPDRKPNHLTVSFIKRRD